MGVLRMPDVKLEPCKYCGGKGRINRGEDRVTVECAFGDFATSVFFAESEPFENAEREAVRRWNDRSLVNIGIALPNQ